MYLICRFFAPLLLMLVTITPFSLFAASFADVPAVARFIRLDVEQGLSQAMVSALAQDHAGNIWIGTQNGLNRFDGFFVEVFRPDTEQNQSISDNFITSLLVDNKGMIWIGTLNGLNRFNPASAEMEEINLATSPAGTTPSVLALHLDSRQQLWIGTNQGLALWQPDSATVQWPGNTVQQTTELHHQNITAISADSAGNVWLGTPRGIARFTYAGQQLAKDSTFPYAEASVMTLYHDKNDRLWVGLEREGLLMREANSASWTKIEIASYANGLTSNEIRSITMDRNGNIWIGTQHGLSKLGLVDGHWRQLMSYHHQRHNPASLGSGKVVSLLEDKDGSIWVGTWNGGVSVLNQANNLFVSLTHDLPLMAPARNPAAISLASSGNIIWTGNADGLFKLDLTTQEFSLADNDAYGFTVYSAVSQQDEILIGHTYGIGAIDPHSSEYRSLPLPAAVPSGQIRRLWATADQLWLAVDQIGLFVLDKRNQSVLAQHHNNRAITFIQPIDEHKVLVGSYSGLSWFDARDGSLLFEHKIAAAGNKLSQALPSAPMAYLKTPDGRHWLATNGTGLFELIMPDKPLDPANAHFKQFAEAQGLASGQLKAGEVDKAGNIWLSSAFGISVFNPQTSTFRNFGYRHGTLRRDYINASSTTLPDGTIVFGGMDGVTLFQPEQVLAYSVKPIAIPDIVTLVVNGKQKALPLAALTIPASGARSFSVNFSTREFIETDQVQFQYRLDPVSTNWVTLDATSRSASFERLPPGHYQFRLRAGLLQSAWSDETTLDVEVLPLWWETWLARLLLLSLLLTVLFALHRFRLKHLRKQQEELAWLVEQRTEALNDRTRALQESKNKAEQTLVQLESTIKELVRTEKMAALGQLVAGVAHEVNTPLGVALTANSVVTEESQMLQKKLASGNIRRQELDQYLNKLVQAGLLLDHNLQRAAQLVANFKQVSVDLTADNQRRFNLAKYLDELLESLSLMWRNRQIRLHVDCPDNIVMDSYPGTIGQIITNFTQNAVVHGFENRASGTIVIRCAIKQDQVEIVFSDNGVGINGEHIERIFDPFFTTNRHQGGTGLGLHIVFNLITQKLGGKVTVDSSPGTGTCFTLLLPLTV